MKVVKKTNMRWVIIVLLFIITVVNYIDRSSISYAITLIAREFSLNDKDIGLILGAFGLGYVFTTLLGGIAADIFGAKKTFCVAIFFWGIALILIGSACGLMSLIFARIVLGLAEGPNFPAMTRAISDWLPEKERGRALSLALISVPLALAIGSPFSSILIETYSWRGAYYILAILSFIWLPIWLVFFTNKPEESRYVNKEELEYINTGNIIKSELSDKQNVWKTLLFNKTLIVNNWAFFVFGYYLFFFMTWLPSYLKKAYQLDLAHIGYYSMIPWLFAAVFIWGMGELADLVFRKTKSLRLSRTYPIFFSHLFAALAIIPILFQPSLMLTIFCLSLAVGFALSANAAYYAVNIDIAKERAGTSLGVMEVLLAISGFISPYITGVIVSVTGHFQFAFILLALLAFSAAILILIFHNK